MSVNKNGMLEFEALSYKKEVKGNNMKSMVISALSILAVIVVSLFSFIQYNEMNAKLLDRDRFEFVIDSSTGIEVLAKRKEMTPSFKAKLHKSILETYVNHMYDFNGHNFNSKMKIAMMIAPKAGEEQFSAWENNREDEKLLNENSYYMAEMKEIIGIDSTMNSYEGFVKFVHHYIKPRGTAKKEYIFKFSTFEVGRSKELINGIQVVEMRLEESRKIK
ncbi:MAG: hypothetical protein ABJH98_17730 [Reichenbachiella sp.]|uniref:hypothetical protein n=1 Tax=Reichenbachiella sp. TaxID=2184521 RepID=UPI0032645041